MGFLNRMPARQDSCSGLENPTGIETNLLICYWAIPYMVAADLKTRQGLKRMNGDQAYLEILQLQRT